jgi:uncharacterized protein GlcG (DUF336 family)
MNKNHATLIASSLVAILAFGASASFAAETGPTFSVKLLAPETALKAAQAALAKCRKDGFQTAVAVVDRSGVVQVVLRDRYAGAHTPDVAVAKAWTAASFKQSTTALAIETQPGKPMSGIRQLSRAMVAGGALPIEAAGSLLGAIAVSGAPGGDADDACAKAGIKAIAEEIEF